MKTIVVHPMDTGGDPDLECEALSLTMEKPQISEVHFFTQSGKGSW